MPVLKLEKVASYSFIFVSVLKLEKVARVINFLVVDCEPVLKSAIGLLDPLPNVAALMAACKVVSHPKGSLLKVNDCY